MKDLMQTFLFIFLFFVLSARPALPEENKLAPDFKLQDTRSELVALSDYRQKQPVLLFFWATWCPFCMEELKVLNEMYAQLAKEGIEVLAINVGETQAKVERFTKKYPLIYKVLLDKNTSVAESYGLLGIPTYFLINKQGKIVFSNHYFPREEYKKLISE